ncbi:hypothetical protein V2J09_003898 [Rumex salicifolius]
MSLPSATTTTTTASPTESVKLCVFDLRRGQEEGLELDKILFFYPSDSPISTQLSIIGLAEGLISFTRNFSPDAACEVIEAERHSHVFYEVEPDIWMVMIVKKNNVEAIWQTDALRRVLKEIHSLFAIFNGSLRAILDKEPSGELIRSSLLTFVTDYLHDHFVGKKLHLPSFRDSLRQRGTVQMLTMGREAAIEVQSLVQTLESCCGNTQCGSLILFHDLLVSTTLSPDDTVNLFTYAILRMTTAAMSSSTSYWSYFRKGSSASRAAADHGSEDALPSRQQPYSTSRPLRLNKWYKGKDGFLVTDAWNSDVSSLDSTIPTVLLQQTKERMYLCAHQQKNLTTILLIPVASIQKAEQGISSVKQRVLKNASLRIIKIEEKLTKGWGGENAYHVGGYRYLLVDADRSLSRASPPAKVATLAKESLVAMCKLRDEVDREKIIANCDKEGHEKELEVCIRASNNAWVIARVSRGKEVYIVLEKASETLLYAADAVERFSNRYCNGSFSLD